MINKITLPKLEPGMMIFAVFLCLPWPGFGHRDVLGVFFNGQVAARRVIVMALAAQSLLFLGCVTPRPPVLGQVRRPEFSLPPAVLATQLKPVLRAYGFTLKSREVTDSEVVVRAEKDGVAWVFRVAPGVAAGASVLSVDVDGAIDTNLYFSVIEDLNGRIPPASAPSPTATPSPPSPADARREAVPDSPQTEQSES